MSNHSWNSQKQEEEEIEELDIPSEEHIDLVLDLYRENKMLRASNKAILEINRLLIFIIFIFLMTGLIGSWFQS